VRPQRPGSKRLKFRAIFATFDKIRLSGPLFLCLFVAAVAGAGLSDVIGILSYPDSLWEILMLKFVILAVASLAFVGTAAAADLPRPQPQPAAAPVGKYPLGKYPVGKSPIGKYPVAAPAPVVTKG
jgi:hypothetical protein